MADATHSKAITPISHIEAVIQLCKKYELMGIEVDGMKISIPPQKQVAGFVESEDPQEARRSARISEAFKKLPKNYLDEGLWPGGFPKMDID